ncbi:MAG: DUF58 domain-containing protein [Lentisphaerae bacterium]|jgi:uncharacterized protein (DUF58 family)|nr:DUF58 domain-containing protein [Lentisphaerota bacterium]MBT4823097.1 DUF58 domain-containing protein [Lentisphaerota bacterium]MBT5605345.1 DUF58 domain-containing protein [Lentisphaerota bacterium]MBT7055284.1 DUF58 domain-containing protein [Lentisphaerota bacterium]MBT7844796.1 DUF58 domain-containing protein [Lentisphaerota bacterium]
MIVPSRKLIWWFAWLAVPLALVAGLAPEQTGFCAACAVVFVAVAVMDLALSTNRLKGIGVRLQDRIRLAKDRQGDLSVTLINGVPRLNTIRIGFPLPREFSVPTESQTVNLPKDADESTISWSLTPSRRGCYPVPFACLETPSRIKLWSVRRRVPLDANIHVYPNLLTDRKALAGLFLNRGTLGIHARRQVGQGREFEKLRDYMPGDSYEDIHWKATAKRGRPMTKQYQIERTQEVYVVIDAARLTARELAIQGEPSARPESLLEYFIRAALLLGLLAERQGDLFGLCTFSDSVHSFVRARNGKAHFDCCRDALYTLHPRQVNPDYQEMAAFIRLRLRRRALLVFLTDLDDPVLAESFADAVGLLARQHVVLVNMVRPAHVAPVFSDSPVEAPEDIYGRLAGHFQWRGLRELGQRLRREGVGFSMLEHGRLSAQLVSQYMDVKQRQVL